MTPDGTTEMAAKLQTLWPEIIVMITAFTSMILGLSGSEVVRRATFHISMAGLALATLLAALTPAMGIDLPPVALFVKIAVGVIGLVLLLVVAEMHDEQTDPNRRDRFDPADASRGEFYGFFLLSLGGAMLVGGAEDLVWLFLSLELTSLPLYVMVVTSRQHLAAPEAAVKYFFLGAFSTAIFLYGFAMLYGATGTTQFAEMQSVFAEQGLNSFAIIGLVFTIIGLSFKVAAFPMHFYLADVYQGASAPVTNFIAFTPKVAGFVGLILIMDAAGWPTVETAPGIIYLISGVAVLTMFVGNILALLQTSVKRVLAYSWMAHSGYMLIGLVAGPVIAVEVAGEGQWLARNGVAALLFYIVIYGAMNLGPFAVLGILKRQGEEAETFDDLRGLASRRPAMAAVMAVCVLSLTGIPPLVGFWGKVFIFGAAISAGFAWLVVLALIASVIGAFYYLRIVKVCYLDSPEESPAEVEGLPWRAAAAGTSGLAVVGLSLAAGPLITASEYAAEGFEIVAPGAEATPIQVDADDPAPVTSGEGSDDRAEADFEADADGATARVDR